MSSEEDTVAMMELQLTVLRPIRPPGRYKYLSRRGFYLRGGVVSLQEICDRIDASTM